MGSEELLLVGGLLCAGLAIYSFMHSVFSNNTDAQALSWATGNEPVKSKSGIINSSRKLVHQFTLQHAAKIKNEKYRKNVKRKISTAGLGSELNVDEFIGLQILWGVMFPLFMLILNFALELGFSPVTFIAVALIGIAYPHIYANSEKERRTLSVMIDLPFFIDLLALSTEAGLDFVGAIQRITEKAKGSVLAEELKIVLKDTKLGSPRAEALKAMAGRLDIPQITSFVAVVVDADATGASIGQVLKDQSVQMRLERLVRAEKAGARASQLILVPIMVFILPAVFIMVFGPVILSFMYGPK